MICLKRIVSKFLFLLLYIEQMLSLKTCVLQSRQPTTLKHDTIPIYILFSFTLFSVILQLNLDCYSVFDFSKDTFRPETTYRKHKARKTQLGKTLSLYSFKHMSVWTAPAIVMMSTTHPTFLVSLRIRARPPANSIMPVTSLYVTGFGWYPNKMVTQTKQYCWNFWFISAPTSSGNIDGNSLASDAIINKAINPISTTFSRMATTPMTACYFNTFFATKGGVRSLP